MNKILILLPHNPGDVIMGLPILTRLKEFYPKVLIDYVVGEESQIFIRNHPYINREFVIPAKSIKKAWSENQIQRLLDITNSFSESLMKQSYDMTVNLFQDNFGALIHGMLVSRAKVGFSFENNRDYHVFNRYMEHLFAVPVARNQNPWHITDIFLKALNLTSDEQPLAILPDPKPWACPFFPGEKRAAVLHIGSAWLGKRWPQKHWLELAQRLLRANWRIVFTGVKAELEQIKGLIDALQPQSLHLAVVNLAGKTDLLQSYQVIKNAEWLISGDTVAMHLAAVAKTKTIALFGASNPVETGPYGKGHFIFQSRPIFHENLPLNQANPDLEAIQPDVVADFILHGAFPKKRIIWCTQWNSRTKTQVLKDIRQNNYPFQNHPNRLLNAIENGNTRKYEPIETFKELVTVKKLLKQCVLSPTKENFHLLETEEERLATKTRQSVIWESYRIHINGLAIDSIHTYLINRQNRLNQAEREWVSYKYAQEKQTTARTR